MLIHHKRNDLLNVHRCRTSVLLGFGLDLKYYTSRQNGLCKVPVKIGRFSKGGDLNCMKAHNVYHLFLYDLPWFPNLIQSPRKHSSLVFNIYIYYVLFLNWSCQSCWSRRNQKEKNTPLIFDFFYYNEIDNSSLKTKHKIYPCECAVSRCMWVLPCIH